MESKDDLIKLIESVFKDVTRDGGVALHEAVVIDHYGEIDEREQARKLDTDTCWTEVPDEYVENNWVFAHFDPIGFRYYLPVYMIWAIKYTEEKDNAASDEIVYNLYPSEDDDRLRDYSLSRFKVLNIEQSQVVALFLQFMINHYGENFVNIEVAQKALNNYWGKYL